MYGKCKGIAQRLHDAFDFVDNQIAVIQIVLKFSERCLGNKAIMTAAGWTEDRLAPDNKLSQLRVLSVSQDTKILIEQIVTALSTLRSLEKSWIDEGVFEKAAARKMHRSDTVQLIQELKKKTITTIQKRNWYYTLQAKANIDYDSKPVGKSTTFGLFISNFNTFMYMANYYSAIPAANLYAKEVGLNETVSGLLLSMTPLSAVISTYFYSQWSNKSFSVPTLISSLFLIFGNYLYATAAQNGSCLRLFLGRLLVGAGGNRAANRRYIADFVELEDRSWQSIIFVAVSGLGMAAGPFVQALMQFLPTGPDAYSIWGYEINNITGPPMVFCFCWAIFLIVFGSLFKEPKRSYAVDPNNVFEPLLKRAIYDVEEEQYETNSYQDYLAQFSELYGSIVCLWVYFALKLVQEAVQTASPLVTEKNFGWNESDASNFLTIIGLVALPTNFMVGFLTKYMDGRNLQLVSLFGLTLGSLITINYETIGQIFSVYQYISGTTILFLCAQVLEGINMAMLAKIMPKKFSKGILNSGFLSTEAGTIGRVCGALTITLSGSLVSVEHLNNLVMSSCVGITTITLLIARYSRKYLERQVVEGEKMGGFVDELNRMKMSIGPMPFTVRSAMLSGRSIRGNTMRFGSMKNYCPPSHQQVNGLNLHLNSSFPMVEEEDEEMFEGGIKT